jgi:hypothetical protein
MQEYWVPSTVIAYDPAMARVCGGVAPGLVFCFLESEFLSGTLQPRSEVHSTFGQLGRSVGMRQSNLSHAFVKIGVIYRSSANYRRACLSGLEFWCTETKRQLFYSLEITQYYGSKCIIRRNARAIDDALDPHPKAPLAQAVSASSARARAQSDAKRLLGI